MEEDVEKNNELNLDFAYRIMSRKLETQMSAHNSLENKIGILLGFVGIIGGGIIVLTQQKTDLLGINIFTIGLFGVYITFLLLVIASQTRVYLDAPDFPAFYSAEALKKNIIDFKNQVIADMRQSYELNMNNQTKKSKLYNVAIYCFVTSMLFLSLGTIGG